MRLWWTRRSPARYCPNRSCASETGMADYHRHQDRMSVKKPDSQDRKAARWAQDLMDSVRAVLAVRPEADPDNVRHTLILLQQPPLERLRRSLTRGRALPQRK